MRAIRTNSKSFNTTCMTGAHTNCFTELHIMNIYHVISCPCDNEAVMSIGHELQKKEEEE